MLSDPVFIVKAGNTTNNSNVIELISDNELANLYLKNNLNTNGLNINFKGSNILNANIDIYIDKLNINTNFININYDIINDTKNIIINSDLKVHGKLLFSNTFENSLQFNDYGIFNIDIDNANRLSIPYNTYSIFNLPSNNQNDICLKVNGTIWGVSSFSSSSDIRIKKNIIDLNDNEMLNTLLKIEPKKYQYIDNLTKGSEYVYGFIADQVENVLGSYAVTKNNNEFIPNIYTNGFILNNILTFNGSELELGRYKVYDKYKTEFIITIIEQIQPDKYKFESDKEIMHDILIYGIEVFDFKILNKNSIFTINVGATQELYKMILKQNDIINNLTNRLELFENNMSVTK